MSLDSRSRYKGKLDGVGYAKLLSVGDPELRSFLTIQDDDFSM